ncbi:hypothetical protein FEC16_17505 [Acinetobacter baumannii]|nr:hypothetical protein ACINWC136_3081 [Acinetobacter pittii]OXS75614.1 hypothetical protein CEX83_02475 [Acinetobacter baumannii]KRJ09752.1 hypothetical protein APC76_02270 [Acinetobacter pittii]OTL20666.1 hypothetical protein B9X78_11980 [Acinetobacter pittii]PHM84132.1 hypothetical protein CHH39_10220 [Acinetobacter baumannii]
MAKPIATITTQNISLKKNLKQPPFDSYSSFSTEKLWPQFLQVYCDLSIFDLLEANRVCLLLQ